MPRVLFNGSHVVAYAGQHSLLEMLDRAEDQYLALLEEAARNYPDSLTGERMQDFDQSISHLVIKYDIPQAPEN